MKLPAWYLLDAISKNVYEPYARRFSSFVVHLFLDTYPLVDSNTRSKMEEMLLTWRTGSPSGKELFGVQQQIAIERGVWGGGASSSTVRSSSFLVVYLLFTRLVLDKSKLPFRSRYFTKITSTQ